jgi:hypothetical protein
MAEVFISYSHDSDQHKLRVFELAESLRKINLDVTIDRDMLPGGPPEGWPHWSEDQVRRAVKVLVVCTENYCRRYLGREESGRGLGAVCEARLIHQELYNSAGINLKYRVILFEEPSSKHVPDTLQAYHRFPLYQSQAWDELVEWLSGTSRVSPIALAKRKWPSKPTTFDWGMADRKELTARFAQMLSGEGEGRVLFISAESSAGKTYVLGELRTYARQLRISCSLLDCKGVQSMEELLHSVILDLRNYCPQGRRVEGVGRAWAIIDDLQQLSAPVLLIIDTYEAASVDLKKWIEAQLLPRVDPSGWLVVVIAGQAVPDRNRHAWGKTAEHVVLQPIRDGLEWHEYSQRRGFHISLQDVSLLALAGGGRPGVIYPLLETLARERRTAGAPAE